MNKRHWFAILIIIVVAAAGFTLAPGKPQQHATAPTAVPTALEKGGYVAGPGLVEPVSEDIKVGSELSGKLREVLVEEGDRVHAGQLVAVLENADLKAQIQTAAAQVTQNEAEVRQRAVCP
jgi:HlyD family secretion protein